MNSNGNVKRKIDTIGMDYVRHAMYYMDYRTAKCNHTTIKKICEKCKRFITVWNITQNDTMIVWNITESNRWDLNSSTLYVYRQSLQIIRWIFLKRRKLSSQISP